MVSFNGHSTSKTLNAATLREAKIRVAANQAIAHQLGYSKPKSFGEWSKDTISIKSLAWGIDSANTNYK